MTTTLAQIVTEVETYVIDTPTAVSNYVQTWVLRAHRHIQELHNFRCMLGLESYPTTAGDESLGVLSQARFKEWAGDAYWTDQYGTTHPIEITTDEMQARLAFNSSSTYGTGEPRIILHRRPEAVGDAFEDHILYVYPIPDGTAPTADGEYNIRAPFWSYLTTPTTSDWLTDNASEFLIHAAVAQAFAVNWDEQRYMLWYGRAYGPQYYSRGVMGGDLLRAINLDKSFQVGGMDTMIPYKGARSPRVGL